MGDDDGVVDVTDDETVSAGPGTGDLPVGRNGVIGLGELDEDFGRMDFGIGQVEASYAGGFFPFLPSVEQHQSVKTVAEAAAELTRVYAKRNPSVRPIVRLEVVT